MINLSAPDHECVVYYAGQGDRIKIGSTTQMRVRLWALKPDVLLAAEEGGRMLELHRHRQFSTSRLDGEWFSASAELLAHIDSLIGGLPLPPMPRRRSPRKSATEPHHL